MKPKIAEIVADKLQSDCAFGTFWYTFIVQEQTVKIFAKIQLSTELFLTFAMVVQ